MAKLAHYYISAVRYNDEHTHIVKVKVHVAADDSFGSAVEWTRSEVVSSIEKGYSFITIVRSSNGEWHKGEDVRIITVGGVKYIRTDANSKATDNLGNLPEF